MIGFHSSLRPPLSNSHSAETTLHSVEETLRSARRDAQIHVSVLWPDLSATFDKVIKYCEQTQQCIYEVNNPTSRYALLIFT